MTEVLAAGRFSSWLVDVTEAEHAPGGAAVPCGECSACCTSSQFIHIGADEIDTIAQIPRDLLFPAPGLAQGNVVLGYDENGHCPMFIDGRCSIYPHRPRTCRTYDCRVFPAAGLVLDDDDKAQITERARRWRFELPTALDRNLLAAVQAAATFLRDHADDLPAGVVPRNPTQLAFLAIKIHGAFIEPGPELGQVRVVNPGLDVVEVTLARAGVGVGVAGSRDRPGGAGSHNG